VQFELLNITFSKCGVYFPFSCRKDAHVILCHEVFTFIPDMMLSFNLILKYR